MDRNSLLQSTFEIVTWPEIQDYMTIDNFKESVIQKILADLQLGIFKVRILDNPVGLISIHTERVRSGKLKILICEIVLVQTLKSGTTTSLLTILSATSLTII